MAEQNAPPTKGLEPKPCKEKKPEVEYKSVLNLNLSKVFNPASTMRDEYINPKSYGADRKDIAKRKALFRSKVVDEMIVEIEQEKLIKDPVEDYCTTYDDMFRLPGFEVNDKTPENTELYLKYPLYKSQPITYYSSVVAAQPKDKPPLPGMTLIRNFGNPFLKNQSFTKPVNLRFDEPA